MTLADTDRPAHDPAPAPAPPTRLRGRLVALGVAIALLVAGVATAGTYYYDSVPLVESGVSHPVVPVAELPPRVPDAFVAAVDPDFYASGDSLITRRYVILAAGADGSGLRTRIMMEKAEAAYAKVEILDRYLNRADYGRGAVGLVAAARTYFGKSAAQLTVAEAALLAVQLHPDRPEPRAGWDRVLDTMVDRGWLSAAERDGLAFPG